MKIAALLGMTVVAIAASGCAARVAVVSNEKNAYVVRSGFFGLSSAMYHCALEGDKPVCTQVEETE